jgi:hypothetical protein
MGARVTHDCRTTVAARKFATVPLIREPLSHRFGWCALDRRGSIAAATASGLRFGYAPEPSLGRSQAPSG